MTLGTFEREPENTGNDGVNSETNDHKINEQVSELLEEPRGSVGDFDDHADIVAMF